MTATPRVSVVVSTYQRAEHLPRLVSALEAQTLPAKAFEVVIVDDGSTDGTAEVLAELAGRSSLTIRAVRSDRNRGPAAGRNLGWRAAQAPVIAFTDDDCIPQPRWLEAGLAAVDTGADIVQGCTKPEGSETQLRWPATQRIQDFTFLYETCNIFYRTRVLEAVGGFDEAFRSPFGEDTATGWAARRLGAVGRFTPEAVVLHSVTDRGLAGLLHWALLYRNWNAVVHRFPEMRRELLWFRIFLRRRTAAFDAALIGVAISFFWRPALLLAVPYTWRRRPRSLRRDDLTGMVTGVLFDGAVLAGLLVGSVKERTVVL